MDINHLRYFLVMAKYQNLTRASEELLVAQPALSMCLTRMEEQLGVPLFDRRKKRLSLNDYGRIFLERAERIVREYDTAVCQLQELKHQGERSLNIGVADWGFPQHDLADFSLYNPDVHVNIDLCYVSSAEDLIKGPYDVVISPLPARASGCCSIPLKKSQVFVLAGSRHRYFDRPFLTLQDLDGEILYLPGFASQFGWYIQKLLKEAGSEPQQIQGCVAGTLPQLLHENPALSIIVPEMLGRIPGGLPDSLRMIPLSPAIFRDSGIIYSKEKADSEIIRRFCRFMLEQHPEAAAGD